MDRFSIAKDDEPPPEQKPVEITGRKGFVPPDVYKLPDQGSSGPLTDNGPNNNGSPQAIRDRERALLRSRLFAAPQVIGQSIPINREIPASFLISAAGGDERNSIRIYPRDLNISTNSVGPDGGMSFTINMEFQVTREQLDSLLG